MVMRRSRAAPRRLRAIPIANVELPFRDVRTRPCPFPKIEGSRPYLNATGLVESGGCEMNLHPYPYLSPSLEPLPQHDEEGPAQPKRALPQAQLRMRSPG